MGFTHIELHAGDGASVRRLVGLSGDRLLRADQPLRHARGLQVLRRRLPSRGHRRDPRLGAGTLSRRTCTASRASTAPRVYEHADPRQGEHQDWGTLIFNYGRHEVRSFLLSNALYWIEEFHVDALRVDAVASMLYLDYSRKAGEWVPNQYRRPREPRGDRVSAASSTRWSAPSTRTCAMIAEESTSWPGVTRPVHLGGLGFTYKWNMGWMHDMLDYCKQDPIYRKYHHETHHVLAALRLQRELHPAVLARRGRARQAAR